MAKILSVHESIRCSGCGLIGARWKCLGRTADSRTPHRKRIRNRWNARLDAQGWKHSVMRSEFGAKITLNWCPDCREGRRPVYPSTADLAAEAIARAAKLNLQPSP